MILEEFSVCISYLYKQIPFILFLVGGYSNHFRLHRYRPILRPIFVVVKFKIDLFILILFNLLLDTLLYNKSDFSYKGLQILQI